MTMFQKATLYQHVPTNTTDNTGDCIMTSKYLVVQGKEYGGRSFTASIEQICTEVKIIDYGNDDAAVESFLMWVNSPRCKPGATAWIWEGEKLAAKIVRLADEKTATISI